MYFECSECQVVLHAEHPPLICPRCGLAGVIFCSIDEGELAEHLAEGDEWPLELTATDSGAPSLAPRL